MTPICLSPMETLIVLGIYFVTFGFFILVLKLMARAMDRKVDKVLTRFEPPTSPRPNVKKARVGVDTLLRSGVLRKKERGPDEH